MDSIKMDHRHIIKILYFLIISAGMIFAVLTGTGEEKRAEAATELIDKDTINAGTGDDFYLSDFMNVKRNETFEVSYDPLKKYTDGIELYTDGEIKARVPGEITVKLVMMYEGTRIEDSVRIVVYDAPSMSTDVINRAAGTDRFLPVVYNAPDKYNVYYDISERSAAHDENGYLKTDDVGSSKVTMHLIYDTGHEFKVDFILNVTDPHLRSDTVNVAVDGTVALPVTGTVSGSSASTQDDLKVSFDGLNVVGLEKGTEKNVTFMIDGREFSMNFNITDPKFDDTCYMLYKGISRKINVKGLSSGSHTVYRINGHNAKITGKKVKAVRKGNSYLTATVDGKEIKVQVAVTSKKAYYAVKKELAIAKTRTVYSQARRMSAHYYDCSSLVYRAYRLFGIRFGNYRSWAPTAADIGRWCVNNKKVISYKSVTDYNDLLPGDLIFFAYAGNNGRYRHISHIETYVGGGYDVSASSTYGRVVKYATQSANKYVVLVARPV